MIEWRGIELGKVPQRRGNEIDLFQIGTAVSAGRKMQADPDFAQDGKAIVQILGGSIRDITARHPTGNPL
jgi:hypothetical protein